MRSPSSSDGSATDPAAHLRIIHPHKRTLGDKLQELAVLGPEYLKALETLVDSLLRSMRRDG